TNVRDLRPGVLPYRPGLVVADLSFISLRRVLEALACCAADRAELVLLVKPQFEARREEVVDGGVVADPSVWRRTVLDVARGGTAPGPEPVAVMASPLPGPAGNAEFLLHLRRPPEGPGALDAAFAHRLDDAVGEAARRLDPSQVGR